MIAAACPRCNGAAGVHPPAVVAPLPVPTAAAVVEAESSGLTEKEGFYKMVATAGGKVLSYFRDFYAGSHPDFTLCGPLVSCYLLEGSEQLMMHLAIQGFGQLEAVRGQMDKNLAALIQAAQELEKVKKAIASFEDNYWAVNHGAVHHARKSRELAALMARQTALEADVKHYNRQAATILWRGRVASGFPTATPDLAGLLRHCLTQAGRWALSLERPGQTGHFLGIVVNPNGTVELFDPDWAFVLFPSLDALIKFLTLRLGQIPSFLEGRSILMPIEDG